ncbi:MAG: CRTAC1 family protein [Hyphomicrobiaceae bacterium]
MKLAHTSALTFTLALSLVFCLGHSFNAVRATEKIHSDIPQFKEVSADAGVSHKYIGPWEFFVGGGVAAFDCSGDRRPDLVLAGGEAPTKVLINESETGGQLKFRARANSLPKNVAKRVVGAYPIDIDNDGIRELVLIRVGENSILKGLPDCEFEPANGTFNYSGGRAWTTAFAATFETGNLYPTLAFGNYVDRSAPGSPWGTCHDNILLRPSPNYERPDYREPQLLSPGYCALSILFTDWNRSGEPSLRITNDRQYYRGGQEQLWRIPLGRPARPYRATDGWRAVQIWGMGIAEADLDGDGYPEYALTSMGDTKLQQLDQAEGLHRPTYRDIAFERGATAHRPYVGDTLKPSTGWHAEFADFNNDRHLDLYIAKGNVEQMSDFAAFDPDNLLLGQHDGKFVEAGQRAGVALDRRGRGAAVVDLNMDGMLDLVVVNRSAAVSLFQNMGGESSFGVRPMGNWLQIELRQKNSNRDAIGARIAVKTGNSTQIRTIAIGGGHASGRIGFQHFGIATAQRAEVRVRWPSGSWSASYRVFANSFVSIEQGESTARYWYPPQLSD